MKSKYEVSVEHAMVSWHKALKSDSTGDESGKSSLAVKRRDLVQSIVSEDEGGGLGLGCSLLCNHN